MNEQENEITQRKKNKKIVKIILIVCAAVLILSAVTAGLDPDKLVAKLFGKEEETDTKEKEITFCEPDWEANIFENAEYMGLDRNIYYNRTTTGEIVSLDEDNLSSFEPGIRFFYDYFDSVICGAYGTYRSYFTDAYIAANELPEKFTMQMLYDMEIREYPLESDTGDGDVYYLISYKIHCNNGTFRQDIGSDASRTQLFCLTGDEENLKINSVVPYTRY